MSDSSTTLSPLETTTSLYIDNSSVLGRSLIGVSYVVFGLICFLLNATVLLAVYRSGLLSRGGNSAPVFMLVSLVLIDGTVRGVIYTFYLAPSIIVGSNLGDGTERFGYWSHTVAQFACSFFNMAKKTEVLIAINRLLVIKRIVSGNFAAGFAERLFSRRNCLIYAALIQPWEFAFQNNFFLDTLAGLPQPCCA